MIRTKTNQKKKKEKKKTARMNGESAPKKGRREQEYDDRRQTWIVSKSNENHTIKLHAYPTHRLLLSHSLSSTALKQQHEICEGNKSVEG